MNWFTWWRFWHVDSILKQTIILADKTGLRKKAKKGRQKPKQTRQQLAKMNQEAGEKFMQKMMKEGKIEPSEVAEMVRNKLNT